MSKRFSYESCRLFSRNYGRCNLITGSGFSYPTLERVWAQEEGTPLKVALLTDALFSDGGWGATAYNASQALKEKYGLELTTVENVAIPDIEPTLRDFADQGNNLIIAHGFEWGDPLRELVPTILIQSL